MKKYILLLPLIFLLGCSTKVMLPDGREQLAQSKATRNGQEVFMASCNRCHPAGNAGLGPSIINKPIPGFMIRAQVRNGFGVMPSFDKEHLSENDLDDLVAYIKEIR